jgi:flagella basal body P-ring formation protein FlgA
MILKRLGAALALSTLIAGAAFAGQPVMLKRNLEAGGPAITIGDLFAGCGAAGARAVAPAPAAGQNVTLSASFVSAAAAAAGCDWKPPPGVTQIVVGNNNNGALLRAPKPFAALTPVSATAAAGAPIADAAIHRGDIVTLVYVAPGLQLTTRAQALDDGQIGGPVRVVNMQSNRTVDAVVTGPGAASANPGLSY